MVQVLSLLAQFLRCGQIYGRGDAYGFCVLFQHLMQLNRAATELVRSEGHLLLDHSPIFLPRKLYHQPQSHVTQAAIFITISNLEIPRCPCSYPIVESATNSLRADPQLPLASLSIPRSACVMPLFQTEWVV